jgi:hypothetical protein
MRRLGCAEGTWRHDICFIVGRHAAAAAAAATESRGRSPPHAAACSCHPQAAARAPAPARRHRRPAVRARPALRPCRRPARPPLPPPRPPCPPAALGPASAAAAGSARAAPRHPARTRRNQLPASFSRVQSAPTSSPRAHTTPARLSPRRHLPSPPHRHAEHVGPRPRLLAEPLMLQRLLGRGSRGGVVVQHALHELDGLTRRRALLLG